MDHQYDPLGLGKDVCDAIAVFLENDNEGLTIPQLSEQIAKRMAGETQEREDTNDDEFRWKIGRLEKSLPKKLENLQDMIFVRGYGKKADVMRRNLPKKFQNLEGSSVHEEDRQDKTFKRNCAYWRLKDEFLSTKLMPAKSFAYYDDMLSSEFRGRNPGPGEVSLFNVSLLQNLCQMSQWNWNEDSVLGT